MIEKYSPYSWFEERNKCFWELILICNLALNSIPSWIGPWMYLAPATRSSMWGWHQILSGRPSIYLLPHSSIHLSTYPSIHHSIYSFFYCSICLSTIHPIIHLSTQCLNTNYMPAAGRARNKKELPKLPHYCWLRPTFQAVTNYFSTG